MLIKCNKKSFYYPQQCCFTYRPKLEISAESFMYVKEIHVTDRNAILGKETLQGGGGCYVQSGVYKKTMSRSCDRKNYNINLKTSITLTLTN